MAAKTEKWISIDPGMTMGLAFWRGDDLEQIAQFKCRKGASIQERIYQTTESLRDTINAYDPATIVIEQPEFFLSRKGFGVAARGSLESVCYIFGGLVGIASCHGCTVRTVLAKRWKGQVPKDVMIEHIKNQVDKKWIPLIDKKSDVWDAVGLGLWNIGRI